MSTYWLGEVSYCKMRWWSLVNYSLQRYYLTYYSHLSAANRIAAIEMLYTYYSKHNLQGVYTIITCKIIQSTHWTSAYQANNFYKTIYTFNINIWNSLKTKGATLVYLLNLLHYLSAWFLSANPWFDLSAWLLSLSVSV